jgi:hypothetical protein
LIQVDSPEACNHYAAAVMLTLYLGCIVTNSLILNLLDAGVFAEGGMKPYLQYVRSSSSGYSSRYVPTTLEWRDDVEDGLEVSTRL